MSLSQRFVFLELEKYLAIPCCLFCRLKYFWRSYRQRNAQSRRKGNNTVYRKRTKKPHRGLPPSSKHTLVSNTIKSPCPHPRALYKLFCAYACSSAFALPYCLSAVLPYIPPPRFIAGVEPAQARFPLFGRCVFCEREPEAITCTIFFFFSFPTFLPPPLAAITDRKSASCRRLRGRFLSPGLFRLYLCRLVLPRRLTLNFRPTAFGQRTAAQQHPPHEHSTITALQHSSTMAAHQHSSSIVAHQ